MKDKLMVINKYKDLIERYSNYSLIYPKKYYVLKDKLESILFDFLKELYIVNSISNKEVRLSRKEELLGNIKYLNYLFNCINKVNILSDKQYKSIYIDIEVIYMDIEVVYKYLVGWLKCDRVNR